jgi:hypothetical protein
MEANIKIILENRMKDCLLDFSGLHVGHVEFCGRGNIRSTAVNERLLASQEKLCWMECSLFMHF